MSRRRPIPTTVPNPPEPGMVYDGVERAAVNRWLSEWGDDRRELEAAEKLLETIEADLTANLRDKFAMAALTGLLSALSNTRDFEVDLQKLDENLSAKAYSIADAMLEARKKR